MRVSFDHVPVEPGSRVRITGHGVLATEKDVELASVRDGGSAVVTIPERVFIVGTMAHAGETDDDVDLEVEVLPPERRRDPVPVEPDRTYTISLPGRCGDLTVTTPQGEVLCRIENGAREWWATFTTPKKCATVMVDRAGAVLLAETPLLQEDFEPELSALNAKLNRKGFWIGFPRLQPIDDGRDRPVLSVEAVAMARRGVDAKPVIAKEVVRHGKG